MLYFHQQCEPLSLHFMVPAVGFFFFFFFPPLWEND